ncbi:hypothetical protein [Burkholderia anthina]|uniref:hypothetical protein n=1 Tax=Burkholderia anthina TaxID=179879 RepID=UPI00313347B5
MQPLVAQEFDGIALLMDVVNTGLGATVQPGSVVCRASGHNLRALLITDPDVRRQMLLASQYEDELSPATLATRVVIADVARELATSGLWPGTILYELNTGSDES